jgi:hypothetical protein
VRVIEVVCYGLTRIRSAPNAFGAGYLWEGF